MGRKRKRRRRKNECEFPECETIHDGKYGSGRFCSVACARKSATYKRMRRPGRISKTMKKKSIPHLIPYHYKPRGDKRSDDARKLALHCVRMNLINRSFETTSMRERRCRVLEEQDHKCLRCDLRDFQGELFPFVITHLDGDTKNNDRYNLAAICPLCFFIMLNRGFRVRDRSTLKLSEELKYKKRLYILRYNEIEKAVREAAKKEAKKIIEGNKQNDADDGILGVYI